MIEKWNEIVDNGGVFGALMTDLSKAFDCLHHGLLVAKLEVCDFEIKTVKLIKQYFSNRKQREVLFKCFDFNYMKINNRKSYMLFSGNDNIIANIDDHTIISINKNELLGIILDSKLPFEDHINNLCKKASQKLNALARVPLYMCLEKRKTVMKAYIISQFGYSPLVWMFHSGGLNNKINSLHESVKNNML